MALSRKSVPTVSALALLTGLVSIAHVSAANPDPAPVALAYGFERMEIAMPPGYEDVPKQSVRVVNPAYHHIRSWISSVGASVAINDVRASGRQTGMCLVDTRTDLVIVTYTPTAAQEDQFTPFTLDPEPSLEVPDTAAPMGCAPGDFNGDGVNDFLVYYWGRTPVMFMGSPGTAPGSSPRPDEFEPVEMIPSAARQAEYGGELWNTNAVLINDLSGDGMPDIIVGNYFPQSGVLDPHGQMDVQMNDSLSRARNGGGPRVMRWVENDENGHPVYIEDKGAVPYQQKSGWTLGIGSGDLTGDLLPEVYLANDFGHDHLLYNMSTPDEIKFGVAYGSRGPTTPKSFVLGEGSFKGMGVDFVDLWSRGKFDMLVSNITTAWGLQESNFVWRNDADTPQQMKANLESERAPFTQVAQETGMAWTGWSWDIKSGDFTNSGTPDVVQTDGFVKGDTNRWAWLQELATANDVLVREPEMWPNVGPGDDLAGHQKLAFYAHDGDGRWADISSDIGVDIRTPSRGVAIADTTGTGALDFAIAYQFDEAVFYRNTSPTLGNSVQLRLVRPALNSADPAAVTPAYGAKITLVTPDGRSQLNQVDGGSGHGGKRGFNVHFGIADQAEARAQIEWRDRAGDIRTDTLNLRAGLHTIVLTDTAEELAQ